MLDTYILDGQPADSLDLKCLLIGTGMQYPARVHEMVAGRVRLEPPSNPYACNCIILPGEVAVHLTVNDALPFALDLDDNGLACLFHDGTRLTEVSFPPPTKYYSQQTRDGRPFGAFAVLEGRGLLAFFYMWPCEYIRTQETCEFCFQVRGNGRVQPAQSVRGRGCPSHRLGNRARGGPGGATHGRHEVHRPR